MKTPTTIKLQQLIFGAFDQKTSIIWLIGPLGLIQMDWMIFSHTDGIYKLYITTSICYASFNP
jgi:hypothetical protein